ncbi:MAG TPA: hypothetical protein VMB72_01775 [Acidimicrobiales bacterium]|nr:hypothetical protein [Acidimicrobiales bacterium]
MGLFDTILGRTKPVRPNLDALFALPPAAVTLQITCGLVSTGHAGVCFKPPAGQPFAEMQAELEQLLATPDDPGAGPAAAPPPAVRHVGDRFGYRWILVDAGATDDLVTRVHMVHSSLQDAGWGTQLLCSVFGFAPAPAGGDDPTPGTPAGDAPSDPVSRPVFVVYLAKQGTFYPFAPLPGEKRDNELELRLRSIVADDLPIEGDLSRWFPIWDLPVG